MKIANLKLVFQNVPIELTDIEIDVTELNAIQELMLVGRKVSKECYWSNVCIDFPSNCQTCSNNPQGSHYVQRRPDP